ncbi:hypothetical protein NUSPORA_01217 [Nucleospora cyclopteri]
MDFMRINNDKIIVENDFIKITLIWSEKVTVKQFHTNLISFNDCFSISGSFSLPKYLICRNNRVFFKIPDYQLKQFNYTLISLQCKKHCSKTNLSKLLPTIFNKKVILEINGKYFLIENMDIISEIAGEMIGNNEAIKIIKERLNNIN